MRRAELEALGIQLAVLPTLALGALPGPPEWAGRLMSIGLDVLGSGAAQDTPDTWRAAHAVAPRRPMKAMCGDAAALAAAGALVLEGAHAVVPGTYRLDPGEAMVAVVDGADPVVEDPNVVARRIVDAVAHTPPVGLWVAATPGLHAHPVDVVEAKLRALTESAYRARLAIAKLQFELD